MSVDVYAEAKRLAAAHGIEFADNWVELAQKYLSQMNKNATSAEQEAVLRVAARVITHRLQKKNNG